MECPAGIAQLGTRFHVVQGKTSEVRAGELSLTVTNYFPIRFLHLFQKPSQIITGKKCGILWTFKKGTDVIYRSSPV